MLKRSAAVFVIACCWASAAFAEVERVGEVEVGLNVSAALSPENETSDSVYVGGNLAYGVTEWVALGISGGWKESNLEVDVNQQKLDSGDLRALPLFGEVIIRIPAAPQTSFHPYLVGGIGGVFWHLDESSQLKSQGLSSDVENGFAFKLGGGLDWFVNDRWLVFFEAAYIVSDADVRVRNAAGADVGESNDIDFWTVGGGIKYRV